LVAAVDIVGVGASVATAALWALGAVIARLGMIRARPALLSFVGVLVALPILLAIVLGTGQSLTGFRLTWTLLAVLAGVALCSQVAGSVLTYDSIRFIGASRSVTISTTRIIFSTILGVMLLGEVLTPSEALGSSLVLIGIVTLTLRSKEGESIKGFRLRRGAIESIAGALVFSVGNVLVRVAAIAIGSAAVANLLTDLLAIPMLLLVVTLDKGTLRNTSLEAATWRLLLLLGVVFALSSYTFFVALSVAPVVYVIPLSSSSPLFAVIFSLVAIRGMENVNAKLVAGAVLTVIGSVLIAVQL
jgi:uncharacterized membrane protein